ncbi:LysR substrate-binding domain-containing protein [Pseudosulfitobacter sp. SM2401]|uniref:LysR family transcriptional regulator n=1 Tax=Pseudosulfitobacter sp. SM2401 TaxID=3350098 RepID=UPI0036F4336E
MKFTLKQLRYFDAALRLGSIARASEEMNISQSSVTAALDLIEQSIGQELFRRIPAKGIIATQAGQDVGKRVSAFLEQARLFESDLLSLTGDPTGTLRLGCYEPTAPFVLPPLMKQIAATYPDIRIDLKEGNMHQIADWLRSNTVDVALTYQAETPSEMPFLPLFHARPWALIPHNSPLSQQTSVSLQDLKDEPMVALDLPAAKSYFEEMFQIQGLVPNVAHTTQSSAVLRGMVAGQFGYSILNICGPNDRDKHAGYAALPINGAVKTQTFGLAYSAVLQQSTIVDAVIKICEVLAAKQKFSHLLLEPTSEVDQ